MSAGNSPGRLATALNGFLSVAAKELLHIRRDPTTLVFALLIPLLQLILFGYAINHGVRHIRTALVDMDRTPDSRAYAASLVNTHSLDIVAAPQSPVRALPDRQRGDVSVVVIIPPDFARRSMSSTNPAPVRVLLDGSNSQVADPARTAFMRPADHPGPRRTLTRIAVLYNPQMRTAVFTIPGLIGVILQLITVSLTSFSLVREREQGTMEQLMVSPVGKLGQILGKLCPYAVLAS